MLGQERQAQAQTEGREERQERERAKDLDQVAELPPPVDREAREERARIQERGEERPGRGAAQRAIEAEVLVARAGRMEGGDDPGEVRVESEAEREASSIFCLALAHPTTPEIRPRLLARLTAPPGPRRTRPV